MAHSWTFVDIRVHSCEKLSKQYFLIKIIF